MRRTLLSLLLWNLWSVALARPDFLVEADWLDEHIDDENFICCHDGFRMSLACMQLKHLGVKDVRLYNGGWSHWGNELTLPVLQGDAPYSGDYEL